MNQSRDKRIEIEYRSMFNEAEYRRLKKFLASRAKDKGRDNKDVHFFVFPDKFLKVSNNLSERTAKIVLKLNQIGRGSDFEELEIPISQDNVDKAVKMFTFLGFDEVQHSFQRRHNYLYKGVEIALKYSETWGYHLELEILVNNKDEKEEADKKIKQIAEELGIRLMTEEELSEFADAVRKDYQERRK